METNWPLILSFLALFMTGAKTLTDLRNKRASNAGIIAESGTKLVKPLNDRIDKLVKELKNKDKLITNLQEEDKKKEKRLVALEKRDANRSRGVQAVIESLKTMKINFVSSIDNAIATLETME